jgi:hypothetical protein
MTQDKNMAPDAVGAPLPDGSDQVGGGRQSDGPVPIDPQLYTGTIGFVMVRTESELRRFVPYPLELVDAHRAFVKIYQLKRRPLHGEPLPPAYSQYLQVCLCVRASPPGHETGHYNLMVWEMRDWTMPAEPHGARKKFASIETTVTFPDADRYDRDRDSDDYQCDVRELGDPVLRLTAHLDGIGVDDPGVSGGFYRVRYFDDGDPRVGSASAQVTRIDVEDVYLGQATKGVGELELRPGPGYSPEEIAMFDAFAPGSITIEGVTLRDVGWIRRTATAGTWIFPPSAVATGS